MCEISFESSFSPPPTTRQKRLAFDNFPPTFPYGSVKSILFDCGLTLTLHLGGIPVQPTDHTFPTSRSCFGALFLTTVDRPGFDSSRARPLICLDHLAAAGVAFPSWRNKQECLKQEYHTARRLRRQYETDLSLARTLQATFDFEATPPLVNQMGNGLLPLVSDSAQPPPRESRQRRRRKARKSRLQGRNIKRHLAQLALSLRCQSSAHIASPCACSPASDESLPLSYIGILSWWSSELRECLEAELGAALDDCIQQQAPQQPYPPFTLWDIYDYGDKSSMGVSDLLLKLNSAPLDSTELEDLHTILVLAPTHSSFPLDQSPASSGSSGESAP